MSAPLVVNTRDGVCWTRRTVTSGGLALYAPESVRTCPDFVMATLAELAEQGIAGSADALPMPVPVSAGEGEAEHLRASRWDATKVVAQMESKLLAMHGELTRATERVAELEAERHSTNEALSDAAEQLRANRDRITELEAAHGLICRECAAPVRWVENPNGGWWNHTGPASSAHSVVPKPAVASSSGTYPPAMPWAKHLDHEDLTDFLDELAASAITNATSEVALTEVEDTIGRWRVIAEAQHAHNTAPGPDADEPGMRPAVRIIGGDA